MSSRVIDSKIKNKTESFREKFFPNTSQQDWDSWQWQLINCIKSPEKLAKIINLSENERKAIFSSSRELLPISITPYYASLLDAENPDQAIRKSVVPVYDEYLRSPGETQDPLSEEKCSSTPGLVHRYPDRVLFLVTNFCSVYCRYCTRSRMVGDPHKNTYNMKQWEDAIAYIEAHTEIRDVLLSGGDPLTMPEDKLDWLLTRLREIPHVEFIRIGTKVPVVLPQRITESLINVLKKHHPLWMSIHFTHPDELTPETKKACNMLADAGIPLGSQTVLLKGINDNVETMKKLMHELLKVRVKPYYLYQCDPILGSSHFRTPVKKGLEIIEGMRGHTTGYAIPNYVIDAPGGGGKIPLLPEYYVGREGNDVLLRNFEGETFRYPDVVEQK